MDGEQAVVDTQQAPQIPEYRAAIEEQVSQDQENIIESIDEETRKKIALKLSECFEQDWQSTGEYRKRNAEYLKFFANTNETKDWPWPNASNIKLPMLTNSTVEFQSRIYDEMWHARGIVHIKDPGGDDTERTRRVEDHFNHQLRYDIPNYEEDFEAGLMLLGLNGDLHRKVYYNAVKNTPMSRYIGGEDFVVAMTTRNIEECRRMTHKIRMSMHDLNLGVRSNLYRKEDIEAIKAYPEEPLSDQVRQESEKIEGITKLSSDQTEDLKRERDILEIHTWWDLNQDGIEEPYVFTIDRSTRRIIRAIKRWEVIDGQEETLEYFVHYKFYHNPEGYYGIGLGHVLMNLLSTANTIINQLIDAGILNNLPCGFVTQKSKIKKGQIKMTPGHFEPMDGTVDDISKHIYQFRFGPPDQTLFNLLGLIEKYKSQASNITELMTGMMPGSSTPATTVLALLEQGLKVFGSMFKRVRRSFEKELGLLYRLNSIYLSPGSFNGYPIARADYTRDHRIIPVADPNIASKAQKLIIASEKYKMGLSNPLIAQNQTAVYQLTKDVMEAMDEGDFTKLLPPPQPQQPPDVPQEQENAMLLNGQMSEALQGQDHQLHIAVMTEFRNSPYFAAMTPETLKMFDAHERQHLGFEYLKQKEIQHIQEGQALADEIASEHMAGMEGQPVVPFSEGQLPPELQIGEAPRQQ